jgi:hypothetical protein
MKMILNEKVQDAILIESVDLYLPKADVLLKKMACGDIVMTLNLRMKLLQDAKNAIQTLNVSKNTLLDGNAYMDLKSPGDIATILPTTMTHEV